MPDSEEVQLFYDERDDRYHETRGSRILYWLDDLGAKPLADARSVDRGFLFAGARSTGDYRKLVANLPLMHDRVEERTPLLRLDSVLETLKAAAVEVITPKTWRLTVDQPLPPDLTFPLFVRTATSSWKVGGRTSRVNSISELETEAAQLRRAFGWDEVILARTWHDLAPAGDGIYGPVPQEVRVWIVDQVPFAWSFHYLNVVQKPRDFPPNKEELQILAKMALNIGRAFRSRLVAADFARQRDGTWLFIEAGPGSCAGTNHEAVFKAVARRLTGGKLQCPSDAVGGGFPA